MNISETEAYVTNWPVFAAKELDELRSERDALAARLAAAEREREALRQLVDDIEQMAVDGPSGCTTCTRVVNACVSFAMERT